MSVPFSLYLSKDRDIMVTRVILIFFFSRSVLYLRPSFCQSNKRHVGGRRTPLSVRKKPKRTNRRLVRNVVAYLKSDAYLFAPLFSKFSPLPPQIQMPPPLLKAEVAVKKNKKRLSEKVKEYLNSDCHMYRPMISLPKPGSALKGESFF